MNLASNGQPLTRLALGGSLFGAGQWDAASHAERMATMEAALRRGLNHFDTASDYGGGESERVLGRFAASRRDQVFVASKAAVDQMDAAQMLAAVDRSRECMGIDCIDLYYVHWPREGRDPRPLIEGLEMARAQGKIRLIGISNFSLAEMEQAAQAGRIDAHQLCYSLLWRFAEADIIPYCRAHNIAVVTYSSVAQGVLTGKFPRQPRLAPGDSRAGTVHFEANVWPHVYAAVEAMKQYAVDRPLAHLAIRWVLAQPGIDSAVVSARTAQQLHENADALDGDIPAGVFEALTALSDEAMRHIPDTGNMYRYYP